MMKEKIIHMVVFGLLLLGMSGCSKSGEGISPVPPPDPALLELDIMLPARANGSDIPACEQVKVLRLIMVDAETGTVEYNELLDISSPSVLDGKPFRYSYRVRIESTAGTKYLYALANAENLIGDIVSETSGEKLMEGLETLELTGDIGKLNTDGSIPIVPRKYEVKLGGQSAAGRAVSEQKAEIVMAYAATKFDFTFINTLNTSENVNIVGWQIDKVAKKSYLVPHMGDDAWNMLIGLGGTVDDDEWVTAYTLPQNTTHEGYSRDYPEAMPLTYGTTKEDPTTYYLHESRYFGAFGSSEQEYIFSLRIKPQGWSDADPPIILSGGKLPNLKSLVRGTHVVVQATLRNMPEPGDNSLEVRVKTWINDDPVSGGWEEVTQ